MYALGPNFWARTFFLLFSTKVGPYRLKFGPTAQNVWQRRGTCGGKDQGTCGHRRTRRGGWGGCSPPWVRPKKSLRPKFLGEDLFLLLSSTKVGPYRLKFGPTAQNLWQNRPKSVTWSKIRLGPKIFDRPKIVARPKNLSQPPLFLVARTPMSVGYIELGKTKWNCNARSFVNMFSQGHGLFGLGLLVSGVGHFIST